MSIWDVGDMLFDQAPDMFAQLGATGEDSVVVLTRQSELTSQDGTTPSRFKAKSASTIGSSSITIGLATSLKLAGKLLAGTALTVGGSAYSVTTDVYATGNSLIVSLSAPLVAAVSVGDDVVASAGPMFTFNSCIIEYIRQTDHGSPSQLAADVVRFQCIVSIPQKNAPTEPRIEDTLTLGDGNDGRIYQEPLATNAGFWDCRVVG